MHRCMSTRSVSCFSSLLLLLAAGCVGSVDPADPGGGTDSASVDASLAAGRTRTFTGSVNNGGTWRKGIKAESDGTLTVTLAWTNPAANLALTLRKQRTDLQSGTPIAAENLEIARDVEAGEAFTVFVKSLSGSSAFTVTVNLDGAVAPPPPAPVCGDANCNGTETCSSCAADCGQCPAVVVCGDASCGGTETCNTCAADCGQCPPAPPACGDETCNGTETCSSCGSDCGACPPPPPPPPTTTDVPAPVAPGKQWSLVFSEEFDGASYDKAKLTPCFDWNWGACTSTFNTGREHYDPGQILVEGGVARMLITPRSSSYADGACQNGQCTYNAGLLSTARKLASDSNYLYTFTYGYVEARIKFPAQRGFFTAFWMLPADPSYSYRSEIDIVEILGDDPTTMFMTYHYNDRSSSHGVNNGKFNNGACPVKDYSKEYTRFGVDWQPDHVAWYIDGIKCGEFKGNTTTVESGPMQVILNNMVDMSWQRSWGVGLTDPTQRGEMGVDYLRIYQQK
jgi:beta-glucanase (GH16 family)